MTQERLTEIKGGGIPRKTEVLELISALEESQHTEQLIVQIFEAGGDLKDLRRSRDFRGKYYIRGKGITFEYRDDLQSALEFILERTRKQEEVQ